MAPYWSPCGYMSTDVRVHLITQLYINSEIDMIYICGDFNGRTGSLKDGIDDIVHGHGEDCVNIVLDCKLCILNGCLHPQNDNFTYISNQGRSVVDYICVPHDCFNM